MSSKYGRRQPFSWIAVIIALSMIANLTITPFKRMITTRPINFKTKVSYCDKLMTVDTINASLFHSQSGEDKTLLGYPFFQNLCYGSYLELGALDGSHLSNTYVFHEALSWKGVLIELTPKHFEALVKNRPNDIKVHAAVCNSKRTVHFVQSGSDVQSGAVSGVWEFASDSFRNLWWKNLNLDNTIPILCEPLRDILAKHSDDQYFDIFSLDVEGAELEVLQSIDFAKAGFGVILIEADGHDVEKDKAVRKHLRQKGYIYFDHYQRSDWFVNERFNEIYSNFMK